MSTPSSLDRHNILRSITACVLNNDVAALEAILQSSDQRDVLNGCVSKRAALFARAVHANFVDIARVLLSANADVNQVCSKLRTPLSTAAYLGHDQMVKMLLEQPDIALDTRDIYHDSALMRAVANKQTGTVHVLLNTKASVSHSLMSAADAGDCQLFELLLHHNADIHERDGFGKSCLHKAANKGNDVVVSLILKTDQTTIDLVNIVGVTPLMSAVRLSRVSTVRLLVAGGANVNHRDFDQQPCLHWTYGNVSILDEFLRAGADPNAADKKGNTALSLAAAYQLDHTGVMTLLLAAKADINVLDTNGFTPLLHAVLADNVRHVQFLLQNGADRRKKGKVTARQAARVKTTVKPLFECMLCGWEGMCCLACRKQNCLFECDKFSDPSNDASTAELDCKLHARMAHQAVLEWTIAMAPLQFPPYVVEHIFDSLKLNSTHTNYQQRQASDFVWIPNNENGSKIIPNFVHLIVEERTHQENIALFIAVHQSYQSKETIKNITTKRQE